MRTVEEHVSSDGRLRFLVVADPEGDLTLGFDGSPWHTHADILAAMSGLTQPVALRQFIDDLLGDRSVIAIQSIPGEVQYIWITDDPNQDLANLREGETYEFRYWSGRPWTIENPDFIPALK